MKREDIVDALSGVGEDLIAEADALRKQSGAAFRAEDPGQTREGENAQPPAAEEPVEKVTDIRAHRRSMRRWTALAAVLVVAALATGTILMFSRVHMGNHGTMQSAATAEADAAEAAKTEETLPATEAEEAAAEEVAEAPAEAAAEEIAEETAAGASAESDKAAAEEETATAAAEQRLLRVQTAAGEIVFELNDSPAAASLLAQLPLTVETEPYGSNEITFQPPAELDVTDGVEGGGTAGMLGYFAPWNNVVMYYGDFGAYPGLYILGEAVEGAELIREVSGEITVSDGAAGQ